VDLASRCCLGQRQNANLLVERGVVRVKSSSNRLAVSYFSDVTDADSDVFTTTAERGQTVSGTPSGLLPHRIRVDVSAVVGGSEISSSEPCDLDLGSCIRKQLLFRACGRGHGHHGRLDHPLRGVIQGHDAIAIDHAVIAHHITAIPGWQAE